MATIEQSDPARPQPSHSGSDSKRTSRSSSGLLFALILLVGLAGIGGSAYAVLNKAESGKNRGLNLTHKIARGDLKITVVEQGALESSDNDEIKCRIRGWSKVTWIIESGTEVQPGDELVRIDTKRIEDAISKHTTDVHTATATLERTKADVAQAEMAEEAYLEGRYKTQRKSLDRALKIAKSNYEKAQKMLDYSKSMFNRGYVSELEVEGNEFTVTQARLELEVAQTRIDELEKYTREMELETIRGRVLSTNSKLKADLAGLAMDKGRRDRSIAELDYCVIKADRAGMVIFPSQAEWKETPDVTEGANVRKDQVLLLMPHLEKMQVKVGIHESVVDRMQIGVPATIKLADTEIEGFVKTIASVARPAGWWTGNVVKYDTIISIPPQQGLKPGMSAEVEVLLAEHKDIVLIPVAAVIETENESLCWVKTENGLDRRNLVLGDSNDVFIEVRTGVSEGEEVILNPAAVVEEAKSEAMTTISESPSSEGVDGGDGS